MDKEDLEYETNTRISRDAKHYGGVLPRRAAIVWHGYIVGLRDIGLIDGDSCKRLELLLPEILEDPIECIINWKLN